MTFWRTQKLRFVYKKAVGLGYTLFAAKSMGFDYSYAFANAKIALFDDAKGAEIEFSAEKNADKQKLAARYADETADPINAAKNGYIDNVIEPQFVKQYPHRFAADVVKVRVICCGLCWMSIL